MRIARVPVTSWDMLSVPAASYIAAACLLSVSLVEGVGGALPSAPPAAARVPAARATLWPAALLGPAMLIADARRCDSLPLRPGSLVHRRSPSAACSLAEGPGGVLPSAPPAAARVPAARATPWPAALLGPAMRIADARRRDSLCVFTLALATVRRIMRHAPRGDSIVRLLFDGRHAPRLTLAESRVRRAVLDLPPPSPLPPRPSSLGIIRNAMQIGDM